MRVGSRWQQSGKEPWLKELQLEKERRLKAEWQLKVEQSMACVFFGSH